MLLECLIVDLEGLDGGYGSVTKVPVELEFGICATMGEIKAALEISLVQGAVRLSSTGCGGSEERLFSGAYLADGATFYLILKKV